MATVLHTLAEALSAASSPAFLAGTYKNNSRLVVHVKRGFDRRKVRDAIAGVLRDADLPMDVVVRSHGLRQLAFPKSLETWVGRFQIDSAVYDPTLAFNRAHALVRFAGACRAAVGSKAKGFFFDPDQRTVFVLTKDSDAVAVLAQTNESLKAAMREVARGFNDNADGAVGSELSIRIVEALPVMRLVPVDNASASVPHAAARMMRRVAAFVAAGTALLVVASGVAVAKPSSNGPTFFKKDGRHNTPIYGVLSGLSVFGDGGVGDSASFVSSGLKLFFVEQSGTQLAQHQKFAQVQMPQVNVFGLQVRPRTGVPGQDESQGGSVGS
jgi:hypothetical protein